MDDLRALEHPTLKVPYEVLNKKFRTTQKILDREVSQIQGHSIEISKRATSSGVSGQVARVQDISNMLGGMVERLQALKRKAEASISDELATTSVCKRRLEDMKVYSAHHSQGGHGGGPATGHIGLWRRKRFDRMVVEYFLRNGFYNAAILLAERADIRDHTNLEVFLASRTIEDDLQSHQTGKCLAWCHENRTKLRKLKSSMEFHVRVQEFIELVRADHRMEAIRFARKYFGNVEPEHVPLIQKVMALLAFPADTIVAPYKELFADSHWNELIVEFRRENYRLYHLASQTVFTVALQTGISALKTSQCYQEQGDVRNIMCPVCHPLVNKLGLPLPKAHCSQSRLYCNISGLLINENNPPMMLPNGYIYGQQALEQMAHENNGQVTCPRTKTVYPFKKAEKVFVM